LPLNELSLKASFAPINVLVKTTNADLLDNAKKYTLYTEAGFTVEMFSLTAKAEWNDLTQLNAYNYIHAKATKS
ncbi:MAG: hypothetical protein ABDH59_02675, partial [Fervidobacterium sp.]